MLCAIILATTAQAAAPVLRPAEVEIEDKTSITWAWTIDEPGLSVGDEVRLIDPDLHGNTWAQWGHLSLFPEACTPDGEAALASIGLIRAEAWRGDSRVEETVLGLDRSICDIPTRTCDVDLHKSAVTSVFILSGPDLVEGDELRIILGDSEGCWEQCETEGLADCSACEDCGFEVPGRSFPALPLKSVACRDSECLELETANLEVTPGELVRHVRAIAPSQAVVGEPFTLKVAMLDRRGNAVQSGPHLVQVDVEGAGLTTTDETSFVQVQGGPGWHDLELQAEKPGIYRVGVVVNGVYSVQSNPIEVFEAPPERSIYWGDIHVHSGLTWTDQAGDVHELNHEYARDVAGLQVVAESLKARGIVINEDEHWDALVDACSRDTVEGSFLVVLGFEWMGRVASNILGTADPGHHNVYYDTCEGRFGTHAPETIDSLDDDHGLWDWLRALEDATGVRAVTIPHAMRKTGFTFDYDDRLLQPLAEIYSEWGDNSEWAESDADGTVPDMINSGLRVGFMASSDNHDGYMGNPIAEYYTGGGLAAFEAPALTRADIFEAMVQRRTYATSGIRPIIRVEVEDGDATILPGSEYIAQAPTLRWSYHATSEITKVRVVAVDIVEGAPERELYKGLPDGLDTSGELVLEVDGSTPTAVWLHVEETDDEAAWSSPVFLSFDCARVAEGALDPLGLCAESTGTEDSGTADGGSPDGGSADGGTGDGGTADGGLGDGGAGDGGAGGDEGAETPEGGCGKGKGAALLVAPLLLLGRRRRR